MTQSLRKRVSLFTDRLIMVEGYKPAHVVGLMIGALGRFLRSQGVSKEKFLEACGELWDQNNQPDED